MLLKSDIGELAQKLFQPFPRTAVGGHCGFSGGQRIAVAALAYLDQDISLRLEVVIHERLGRPKSLGDGIDRCLQITMLEKKLRGLLQDPLALVVGDMFSERMPRCQGAGTSPHAGFLTLSFRCCKVIGT